ncbi:hypothetical protein QUF72_23510 [Desulfobacterales bacterium HSG2]|nr:hypothetical protein [Desulfobacterales bacterium HSG2]
MPSPIFQISSLKFQTSSIKHQASSIKPSSHQAIKPSSLNFSPD